MRKVSLVLTMAVAAVVLASTPAQANSISCLESSNQPGDRKFEITVTGTAVCRLTGNGNLNGNGDEVNNLDQGIWETLDKADSGIVNPETDFSITGDNTLGGTFQFSPDVWKRWGRIIVAFKAGQGGINPDWAAFELITRETTGEWAIIGGSQGLGHAILYGADPGDYSGQQGAPVPEPASLALLGLGLVVVVRHLRRKK